MKSINLQAFSNNIARLSTPFSPAPISFNMPDISGAFYLESTKEYAVALMFNPLANTPTIEGNSQVLFGINWEDAWDLLGGELKEPFYGEETQFFMMESNEFHLLWKELSNYLAYSLSDCEATFEFSDKEKFIINS